MVSVELTSEIIISRVIYYALLVNKKQILFCSSWVQFKILAVELHTRTLRTKRVAESAKNISSEKIFFPHFNLKYKKV